MEATTMVHESEESVVAPHACDEITEYDNRIENGIEIDLEDEEPEADESSVVREQIEQQFARYERNYRARRIRELTMAPVVRRRGRPSAKRKTVAAA